MGLSSVLAHFRTRASRAGLALAIALGLLLAYVLSLSPERTSSFLSLDSFSSSRQIPSAGSAPWDDIRQIRRLARKAPGTVVPLHLGQFKFSSTSPAPFTEIYAVSAWLDTRPIVVGMAPQVAILATMPGAGYMSFPDGTFPHNPVECRVVLRSKGRTRLFTGRTTLNALPDPHEGERDFVTVMYHCVLEDGGDKVEWDRAEMYATLSLPSVDPHVGTFLPVTPLPRIDSSKHITGEGGTGMCMPPLTGDIYAPYLRDFIAHYRALGFERFWVYLLDPGPKTLEVVRELALDEEITPVRWGIPKGWLYSAKEGMRMDKKFAVDPSEWKVRGIERLDPKMEDKLGMPQNGEYDIRVWYFAQSAAQQDCTFRAMKEGVRWLGANDWDEFLMLRPAHGDSWPPPSTTLDKSNSPLLDWVRSVKHNLVFPEVLSGPNIAALHLDARELVKDRLPAAFMFRSTFFCPQCRAPPPPQTSAIQALGDKFPGLDWSRPGVGVPFPYSGAVRMGAWFIEGSRTKAVVDPWAWWSVGIHYPGLGFAEWIATRGPCSASYGTELRSVGDSSCAAIFLSLFGPNTVSVALPPALNAESDPLPAQAHGTGALHHYRSNAQLTRVLEGFSADASALSLDVISSPESSDAFDSQRVDEPQWVAQYAGMADESGVVVDWGMLDVMAGPILEILEAKTKKGPYKWLEVGRKGRPNEGYDWKLVGWAVVFSAGVVYARRKTRRRSG